MRKIVYIEPKSYRDPDYPRIGMVKTSKSGKTLYYRDLELTSLGGQGVLGNYQDQFFREYWVSGAKQNGEDALFGSLTVHIDDGIRKYYWDNIRKQPKNANKSSFLSRGKC